MRRIASVLASVILISCWASAQQSAQPFLYRASLVQAAPGKLIELIDIYKARAVQEAAAEGKAGVTNADGAPIAAPLWMRHSQGDRWDLLILTPMGSYASYFRPESIAARLQLEQASGWEARRKANVAWEEDVFVFGPPVANLRMAFANSGFFHVEMFRSLAGQRGELLKEREMENAYARAIQQPDNFIFIRDQGASWDVFTIGCFRDLKHYAQSADVPRETAELAAKAAGFESAAAIGPYLRRFIADHHDTLAVAIR
jgi:hypothetical protein